MIDEMKTLLAEMEDRQALLDKLRRFRDTGGASRLRIGLLMTPDADGAAPVQTPLTDAINDVCAVADFERVITEAIHAAEERVEETRRQMQELAANGTWEPFHRRNLNTGTQEGDAK